MTMTLVQTESKAKNQTYSQSAGMSDARIKSLITLIDTLTALVATENAELAKGLPASRLKQVDEKNRLAEMFERTVAECAAGNTNLNVRDRILREQLLERILNLRAAMDENLLRLRAAIEASNRRIEAVMQAIREQIAAVSPYGASGRLAARAVSSGTSRSA
jgi:biopolymer transport protein ExbD